MKSTAKLAPSASAAEPQQLAQELFDTVGRYRSAPPDRALWRELLALALASARVYRDPAGGRPCSAAALWAVAAAVYFRANSAGVAAGFPARIIAEDCHRDVRTVEGCLRVLEGLRVLSRIRHGRRQASAWWLHAGGLDWPAVRRRAAYDRATRAREAARQRGRSARERGHHAPTQRGHHAPTQGPPTGPCPSVVSPSARPLRVLCERCGGSYTIAEGRCSCDEHGRES